MKNIEKRIWIQNTLEHHQSQHLRKSQPQKDHPTLIIQTFKMWVLATREMYLSQSANQLSPWRSNNWYQKRRSQISLWYSDCWWISQKSTRIWIRLKAPATSTNSKRKPWSMRLTPSLRHLSRMKKSTWRCKKYSKKRPKSTRRHYAKEILTCLDKKQTTGHCWSSRSNSRVTQSIWCKI